MTTICIATLKGGQGKTFISALLCRELSKEGRVLAVSICSQNDINLYLGSSINSYQLYQAIDENNIKKSIVNTKFKNIDLVPYDINDSLNVDKLLQTITGGEFRLKTLLKQISDIYDYVILDTGPNLNISTTGAIIASNYLISPTLMRWSSINGYIATSNALNDLIDLEFSNCKHLGIIRSQTNVLRDSETFEVEDYINDEHIAELGSIPSSTALKRALYEYSDFDKVRPHHMSEVKKLFDNIKTKIL